MAEQVEEITVSRFTAAPGEQDREAPDLFRFRVLLSRHAPDRWMRIAAMELGDGKRVNHRIERFARAYPNRTVACCGPENTRQIKDRLNRGALPAVNEKRLREAEAAHAWTEAANRDQQQILLNVEVAIRNQQ